MYRISFIGAGNIAAKYDSPKDDFVITHAHAVCETKEFDLLGFYDITSKQAIEAAEKWGGKVFQDIDDAISSSDVVCICVPDEKHYDILFRCLLHKNIKAIIIEKPFMKTIGEALEIDKLNQDNSIPIILNHSRRFMKEFHQMKNWIDNKAGNLICGNCFYGKGTLHNGSHLIDIMRYLLGNMRVGGVLNKKCDYKVEDPSFDFYLQTENSSCNVFFHAVPSDLLTLFEFDLMFEYGRVKYSDENLMIEYFETLRDNPLFSEVNYKKTEEVKIEPSSAMRGLYQNVYKVINNMEKPLCNEKDGLYVLNVVEQIRNF